MLVLGGLYTETMSIGLNLGFMTSRQIASSSMGTKSVLLITVRLSQQYDSVNISKPWMSTVFKKGLIAGLWNVHPVLPTPRTSGVAILYKPSREQWAEEGELFTAYFLPSEKRRGSRQTVYWHQERCGSSDPFN